MKTFGPSDKPRWECTGKLYGGKLSDHQAQLVARRHQCPHCDEEHEPGKCSFRIGGVVHDWGQLAGD